MKTPRAYTNLDGAGVGSNSSAWSQYFVGREIKDGNPSTPSRLRSTPPIVARAFAKELALLLRNLVLEKHAAGTALARRPRRRARRGKKVGSASDLGSAGL